MRPIRPEGRAALEVLHQQHEPRFPEPKPGEEGDEPVRGQPGASPAPALSNGDERPALPEHPASTAADIEDADPVIDDGPGIADGATGLRRQRG